MAKKMPSFGSQGTAAPVNTAEPIKAGVPTRQIRPRLAPEQRRLVFRFLALVTTTSGRLSSGEDRAS